MKYLIIASHPYEGSFNAAAVRALRDAAQQKGHSVQTIDLIADGFNPVMTAADLKAWGEGQAVDPLVKTYQAAMDDADVLVFPFPIWWGAMPAVLKGFCDKALLPGKAYRHSENGEMIGLMTDKQAIVITTMETPVDVFAGYFNNPVEGAFLKDTLQSCGIAVKSYLQIDKIASGGRAYAESKLQEIVKLI